MTFIVTCTSLNTKVTERLHSYSFYNCVFSHSAPYLYVYVCLWLHMASWGTYRWTLRKHEAETHAVHMKQYSRSTWTLVQTQERIPSKIIRVHKQQFTL